MSRSDNIEKRLKRVTQYTKRKRSRRRRAFTFWWPVGVIGVVLVGFWGWFFTSLVPAFQESRDDALTPLKARVHYYAAPEGFFTNAQVVVFMTPRLLGRGADHAMQLDFALPPRQLVVPDLSSSLALESPRVVPKPLIVEADALMPPALPASLKRTGKDEIETEALVTMISRVSPSLEGAGYQLARLNDLPQGKGEMVFEVLLTPKGVPEHVIVLERPAETNAFCDVVQRAVLVSRGTGAAVGRVTVSWDSEGL